MEARRSVRLNERDARRRWRVGGAGNNTPLARIQADVMRLRRALWYVGRRIQHHGELCEGA